MKNTPGRIPLQVILTGYEEGLPIKITNIVTGEVYLLAACHALSFLKCTNTTESTLEDDWVVLASISKSDLSTWTLMFERA